MDETKKSYGLIIKKKDDLNEKPREIGKVANVFTNDSDSNSDDEKKKLTASERFDKKYSNNKLKKKIEQSVNEDPSIYEYDEVYDQLKRTRESTEEQKKADKNRKPKYVENIMKAHERRELHKLIHDETVYKKERETEAGAFDDKEAFITESYKKKIAERNEFRQKVEKEDALDEIYDAKNQQMWQQAFHRKMLDNIVGPDIKTKNISETEKNSEIKKEMLETENYPSTSNELKQIKEEPKELKQNIEEPRELKQNKEKRHLKEKSKNEYEKHSKNNRTEKVRKHERDYSSRKDSHKYHKSSHHRNHQDIKHYKSHNREKDSSRKRHHSKDRFEKSNKATTPPQKNQKKNETNRAQSPGKEEMAARMKRIRSILSQRNTTEDIEAARERFFEREKNNIVKLPL